MRRISPFVVRFRSLLLIALLAAVLCSDSVGQPFSSRQSPLGLNRPELTEVGETESTETEPQTRSAREVYDRLLRSTVCLQIELGEGRRTTGTGWVLDADRRLIVTNQHVVDEHETVSLRFPKFDDGRVVSDPDAYTDEAMRGRVVDSDVAYDLAVVQAERLPEGVVALPIAPRSAAPGQRVHAIGGEPDGSGGFWVYANGHVRVVTQTDMANGYVTHVAESDIAINGGNSGGAVVDDACRVVAVAEGAVTRARLVSILVDVRAVREYLDECLPLIGADDPRKKLRLARRHREGGRFATATRMLSEVVRARPELVEAYVERGRALLDLEDGETAILDFDQACRLDPNDADALRGRALAHRSCGDDEAAIRDLTAAVRLTPTDWELYNHRGVVRFSLERYEAAVADFDRALRFAPDASGVYVNRGHALQELGRLSESLDSFDEALRRDERNDRAWRLAGMTFYKQKNYDKAVQAFARACELNDENPENLLCLGDALQEAGDHDAAVKALSASLDLSETATAYYYRGLSHEELGDLPRAVADYGRAIELGRPNAAYHYRRGTALQKLGREEEARADLRRAAELNPQRYGDALAAQNDSRGRETSRDESTVANNPFVGIWQGSVGVPGGRVTMRTGMNAHGQWACVCEGVAHNGLTTNLECEGRYEFDGEAVRFESETETTVRRYRVRRGGILFEFPEFGGWVKFTRIGD